MIKSKTELRENLKRINMHLGLSGVARYVAKK